MRRALILALVSLVTLASGCATAQPERRELPLAPDAVLLAVPTAAQQGDSDCGLACLASLLRFHGLDLDDEARRSFPPATRAGVRAGAIRDYLLGRGLRAHLVHGTLDDARPAGLLRVLAQGVPALVALALPGAEGSHYVLVAGYDPTNRLLMDPAWGSGVMSYDRFLQLWSETGRLMLVAAPRPPAAPAQGC